MNDRDLYKAKRIDNKEWITGNYMFPDQIYDYINKIAYRLNPDTLCRCTGLGDKNGKLIWENDIVCDTQESCRTYGYVCYGEYNCSCCEGVYGWYFEKGDIRENDLYEVVGNIFDNPELWR